MVNTLMRKFRRWPAPRALVTRLLERFTTGPDEDQPEPVPVAPEDFEMRFMRLHSEGRFDEMWDMIAEDAQDAWGGRETFMREVPRLGDDTELLDVQVLDVRMLESWQDIRHGRSYSDVAQMILRYRVREQWKDWTLDRRVHLIPAADGWRTLFYPAQTKSAAGSR